MKHPDEETRKSLREFFGIPSPKRRPIPSNTFNTLVKICSLLPDQDKNPLAQYANCPEYNRIPAWPKSDDGNLNNSWENKSDDVHDDSVPRGEKEVFDDSVRLARVDVQNLPFHNEANSDGTAGDLWKDGAFCGSGMIIDELSSPNNTKVVDTIASYEEGTNARSPEFHKVQGDLSGIERILMDESEDTPMLQLPDKELYLDLADDFGSVLNADVFGNKSMTVESIENEKLTAGGNMKEDVAGEKIGEDVQLKRWTSRGDVEKVQAEQSVDLEIFTCQEFVNQNVNACHEDVQSKDRKLCNIKVPQGLSEMAGLIFNARKSKIEGRVPAGKFSDSFDKGDQLSVVSRGKTKKVKKVSVKDVKSGKHKQLSVDGEAYNSMKSGGDDPMVHGRMLKQNAYGRSKSLCTRKDEKSWPVNPERLRYTREQLLHLGKCKMASVPVDIAKVVREVCAELQMKDHNSAALKTTGACGSNKEQLSPTEDKKAAEKVSSILKNKKRGPSSEARKEKKKLKRKKKRADMNRKLGVKRLKLRPILKPKVVQHCRHYLKGRCQEGENCKFSHDVVPLTKSKPCCHFARQACMKGDDCPYDHQLSKYPCNNYVTTGFCSRGLSCMFSHKITDKEGSGPTMVVSKRDTNSVDQLDISKSKQQLDASVSNSSGIATPKNLKESLATQISQSAKAPKGLHFFSFGKSELEDSARHKESDLSQQSEDTGGASVQQNMVVGTGLNSSKSLTDTPAFGACQEIHPFPERTSVDTSGDKKQQCPPPHGNSPRYFSFGKPLLKDSAKYQLEDTSGRTDDGVGVGNRLSNGISGRALHLSEMLKKSPNPLTTKEITAPSYGGPSYDKSGGTLGAIFSPSGHTDSQMCLREKGGPNVSDKLKEIQQQLQGSPSSGQFPTEIGLLAKSTPSNSQRAFLSTLAFASKHESGIKLNPAAAAKEINENKGTTSGSGSRQNELSQASTIFQFLYGGANKDK